MGALPWEDPDQYIQHSPVYFAGNFKTPTLVLGDSPEADEMDFALRARKVESAIVRLPPGDSPSHRALEIEATLAWIGRR